MWLKQQRPSLPTKWSENLWNGIFGSPWFRLIVDGYQFKEERSEITRRMLTEPGARHVDWSNEETYGSRSNSSITREYFGRLNHLGASHPVSDMQVKLSWQTARQMVGTHEWWHWGTAIVPREGVYGCVSPVEMAEEYATPVSLHIRLGTDESSEGLFEQLFLRSKMPGSGPLFIDAKMTTLPVRDKRIGLISEYTIEHSWKS